MLSRSKTRPIGDLCADCGASDPSWASINRGLLLCAECCSVHRSMGRHISHVKSLRQGTWPPTLFSMVQALNAQNVNNIWEHSLLDPTAPKHLRKKPQPKDPLLPTKSEFILAKHVRLAYVLRPRRDEPASELGRALHSAVRSSSLDTSMRLLAQGADPNYFHAEKGTFCLHVACRAGQVSQAELLVSWGATPASRDTNGALPSDCARQEGHEELANRMVELCYEVTDRLTYFLTCRKADHINGQHYITPDALQANEMTDIAKAARGKLQLLPNHLFEELVMDIYDEVDRRETEAIWQTSVIGMERNGVAFLPVNPSLSAPRNQGRQKLARLSAGEMSALIRDVLIDAARRQRLAALKPQMMVALNPLLSAAHLKHVSLMSDDEPLYDSVASDEDYAALLPIHNFMNIPKKADTVSSLYNATIPNKNSSAVEQRNSKQTQMDEVEVLKRELDSRDSTIIELKNQLRSLQAIVEQLTHENSLLKSTEQNSLASNSSIIESSVDGKGMGERGRSMECDLSGSRHDNEHKVTRPVSMYETREGLKNNWQVTKHQLTTLSVLDQNLTQSMVESLDANTIKPTSEQIHKHAEQITRCIQELWASAQESPPAATFQDNADKIKLAVQNLIVLFPRDTPAEIKSVLEDLSVCGDEMCKACLVTSGLRDSAYNLARATKELLTHYPIS